MSRKINDKDYNDYMREQARIEKIKSEYEITKRESEINMSNFNQNNRLNEQAQTLSVLFNAPVTYDTTYGETKKIENYTRPEPGNGIAMSASLKHPVIAGVSKAIQTLDKAAGYYATYLDEFTPNQNQARNIRNMSKMVNAVMNPKNLIKNATEVIRKDNQYNKENYNKVYNNQLNGSFMRVGNGVINGGVR